MRMHVGAPAKAYRPIAQASLCVQTYFFTGPSYESQLFHHVHVTGIPYGKKCAPSPHLQSAHKRLLVATQGRIGIGSCKDGSALLVSRAALPLALVTDAKGCMVPALSAELLALPAHAPFHRH